MLGMEAHIVEFVPILMARQIDQRSHEAMIRSIEQMGLKVHGGARTATLRNHFQPCLGQDLVFMRSPIRSLLLLDGLALMVFIRCHCIESNVIARSIHARI